MTKYVVNGKISKKGDIVSFEKIIEAKTENHAKELTYSLFGSQNGLKRSKIEILNVKEKE